MRFSGASSYALVELREIYKKGGMREEERQLTFALNHNRRINAWEEIRESEKEAQRKGEKIEWISREIGRLENYFRLAFFEWTCDYGMTSWTSSADHTSWEFFFLSSLTSSLYGAETPEPESGAYYPWTGY